MSLEIIWGPKYYRSDTTKRWSIRAKVIENEKERDYRKTGFQNKKEAKLVWLNYLAENQDESTGMTDKRVDFPEPTEIKEQKPLEEQLPTCNELSVLPSEPPIMPTEIFYFNQHKERHIGLTVYELNEKYKQYKLIKDGKTME